MPAVVRLETRLVTSPEATWALLERPSTFLHVAAPLLGVRDASALPDRWAEGGRHELRLTLLGLPANRHEIRLERLDPAARVAQTRERGGLLRRWDHRLSGHPPPDGGPGTVYVDEVVLDAGPLTPVVRVVALAFFRHRQRRLRALARRHAG